MRRGTTSIAAATALLGTSAIVSRADDAGPKRFLDAKTVFQTNRPYDPRIALAVDGVIVHQHGAARERVAQSIASWREHGYTVGRMFFADSDAGNEYWTGKWDGTPHPQDVERKADGEVVKCSGVRPYMLPTEGWIRYLEEMALESIDAGADAILPEEPLAHVHTGYEQSFRDLWVQRYGRPWEPESASPEARFLTAQLKNELYIKLEQRLADVVRARAAELNRTVDFVLPVHGLYSNVPASLVAPLGTSRQINHVDGYIGQVWTGPVNWCLAHYDAPDKTFFASAYLLYDYFVQLTRDTDRKLWLLVDPVEDNPEHEWAEFEQWYRHCVTAQLLFPDVDAFEVMPWPDRIFLPGYGMAGGTPAPERFRLIVLSATQVLQEVPAEGKWVDLSGPSLSQRPSPRIGVALSDTVMWEKEAFPNLQGVYGSLMPLLQAGVPVSACVMERAGDAGYLDHFDLIVFSHESWKPTGPEMHEHLARWVRRGGALLVLGEAETLGLPDAWWAKFGHHAPLEHLMSMLGIDASAADHEVGDGRVLRRSASPRTFGNDADARKAYLGWITDALRESGETRELPRATSLCMRRGPFIVAHALTDEVSLPGHLVDVFDPELPVLNRVTLSPGSSGVFRDVSGLLREAGSPDHRPRVLHATHRLMHDEYADGTQRIRVRGPAETPAVVRLAVGRAAPREVSARNAAGESVAVDWQMGDRTARARFPNDPGGVELTLQWE